MATAAAVGPATKVEGRSTSGPSGAGQSGLPPPRQVARLVEVFAAGEPNPNGLHVNSFRIPGFLAAAPNGSLVVLAEARK